MVLMVALTPPSKPVTLTSFKCGVRSSRNFYTSIYLAIDSPSSRLYSSFQERSTDLTTHLTLSGDPEHSDYFQVKRLVYLSFVEKGNYSRERLASIRQRSDRIPQVYTVSAYGTDIALVQGRVFVHPNLRS